MLAHQWYGSSGMPVAFLHGLLGSQDDWADVIALLQNSPQIRPLVIDLPFHGKSGHIACRDFHEMRNLLHSTLTILLPTQPFFLVGYSLGGRIALDYTLSMPNRYLCHTVLEGAHVGLSDENERKNRYIHDAAWASRFRHEPMKDVLNAWYQQPVFAALDDHKRSVLIEKKQKNDGKRIAQMLEATGLANQPFYGKHNLSQCTFLIGEHDRKFRHMAEAYRLPYQLIHHAGHNAHFENPAQFVKQLLNIINKEYSWLYTVARNVVKKSATVR